MINELSKAIHENAVNKGFWQTKNIAEKMMLVVTELSESIEAHRRNEMKQVDLDLYNELKALHNKNEYLFHLGFENKVKDGFCDEVADAIIRLLDICGYYGIDIEKQIELKMMYNAGRAYLHNKEY